MRTSIFAVALAACIPAVVCAQRGGGGSSSSAPSPGAPPTFSATSPPSRDLADLNPASMLISKHKKASLDDSTVARLKAVEKRIVDRNAQFFAAYDSVRRWTIPIAADRSASQGFGLHGGISDSKIAEPTTSPAEQAKMQASMRDLRGLMAAFRERHNADVADALAVIPEARQTATADLLGQQNRDLEILLGGRP